MKCKYWRVMFWVSWLLVIVLALDFAYYLGTIKEYECPTEEEQRQELIYEIEEVKGRIETVQRFLPIDIVKFNTKNDSS